MRWHVARLPGALVDRLLTSCLHSIIGGIYLDPHGQGKAYDFPFLVARLPGALVDRLLSYLSEMHCTINYFPDFFPKIY